MSEGILAQIIYIAFFNKIDKQKKFPIGSCPICICLEHTICLILITS